MSIDLAAQLQTELEPLLRARPTSSNPDGLGLVRVRLLARLAALGFVHETHGEAAHAPVVVATRRGRGSATIGWSAHYDVEEEGPGWSFPPFGTTRTDSRIYGRGTADNLGPLLLRLLALEALGDDSPSLVLVLQGEEEVGSPLAHALYPGLRLSRVDLWLEETGYFEVDGRQRLLSRRATPRSARWLRAIFESARRHGRAVDVHDRHLNKAFGEQRCPFLTHLAGDVPYLAIGPNDPESRIHQPDESLAIANLEVSWDQFQALLRAAAEEK